MVCVFKIYVLKLIHSIQDEFRIQHIYLTFYYFISTFTLLNSEPPLSIFATFMELQHSFIYI